MQSKSQDPFSQDKYCTSQNPSTVAQILKSLYKNLRGQHWLEEKYC